ncbi:MAG: hypothetical protein HYY16_09135 [Planctomycetes bacterium]|nr:hypothetical protein [Planctomycetota bacterium]
MTDPSGRACAGDRTAHHPDRVRGGAIAGRTGPGGDRDDLAGEHVHNSADRDRRQALEGADLGEVDEPEVPRLLRLDRTRASPWSSIGYSGVRPGRLLPQDPLDAGAGGLEAEGGEDRGDPAAAPPREFVPEGVGDLDAAQDV